MHNKRDWMFPYNWLGVSVLSFISRATQMELFYLPAITTHIIYTLAHCRLIFHLHLYIHFLSLSIVDKFSIEHNKHLDFLRYKSLGSQIVSRISQRIKICCCLLTQHDIFSYTDTYVLLFLLPYFLFSIS